MRSDVLGFVLLWLAFLASYIKNKRQKERYQIEYQLLICIVLTRTKEIVNKSS